MLVSTLFSIIVTRRYCWLLLLPIEVKPLNAKIISPQTPLVADRRYEVPCQSVGSRPNAIITWYKGKRPLRRTKVSLYMDSPLNQNEPVPTIIIIIIGFVTPFASTFFYIELLVEMSKTFMVDRYI